MILNLHNVIFQKIHLVDCLWFEISLIFEGGYYMKRMHLFLLSLFFILFMTACASEPDETSSGNDGGDEGSGGDLVIANMADAVSLDPVTVNDVPSFDIQSNIFERLVKHDEEMELQPGLAESWESIDDTTWEFKLQEGVTFHDGSEFNADVVKANVERVIDPEVAAPGANYLEMIDEIEIVDDYTIRFITEFPFSLLPSHFAHNVSGIVSKEQIEEDYEAMEDGKEPGTVINENPIGTGYFKFESWTPGESVTLVKNEEYWDGEAKLNSVTFKVVDEDLTRVAEVETGDSHITNPLSPSDLEQVESADGVHVTEQESLALDYIGFNTQKEPFDDERVRQAVSMAIDKGQIVDGIYNGVGQPAIGPLAPAVPGYDDSVSGLEYDVDQAKELLADAGYEDGFSTSIWTNDSRERIDIATNVQSQLKEIGIDVEVETLEWGAYLDKIGTGEHEMFILGWSNSTATADTGIYPLFHSDNLGPSGNRTFLDDEEIDTLIEKGRKEMDEDKRLEIYSDIQEELVERAPMIYILHQKYLLGVRDEVKDLVQLPTKVLYLKDVYIEE